MGLVIDAFAHFIPKTLFEPLNLAHPTHELRELANDLTIGDIDNRIRILDKYKIDKQVVCLARPSIWIGMPSDIILDMTRKANDAVTMAVRPFRDRLIPVGTLPALNEEFTSEFDRCMDDLGMMGIQIFTNIEGKPLDDSKFRWFFSKAHRTRTPIWVHPQLHSGWSQEFVLDKMFGWPFDTTLALSRLVFSGIMEEYKELRIIAHHMAGGMIPHFSGRIQGYYETRERFPRANLISLARDPLDYFRRFYADTVLNSTVNAFDCGYSFFGSDRVVFATDFPYGPEKGERWLKDTLFQIKNAELSQAEKDQILGGNLQRLLERR